MATNLAIDGKLLEEALRIGGHRTKKATVTEALQEYIQRRKQTRVWRYSAGLISTPSTTTRRLDAASGGFGCWG
ncbi:MAG: type II toxin-antitoxin system VapB family antitoxin [Gammaproteobacteria bacterium]